MVGVALVCRFTLTDQVDAERGVLASGDFDLLFEVFVALGEDANRVTAGVDVFVEREVAADGAVDKHRGALGGAIDDDVAAPTRSLGPPAESRHGGCGGACDELGWVREGSASGELAVDVVMELDQGQPLGVLGVRLARCEYRVEDGCLGGGLPESASDARGLDIAATQLSEFQFDACVCHRSSDAALGPVQRAAACREELGLARETWRVPAMIRSSRLACMCRTAVCWGNPAPDRKSKYKLLR